MTPIGTEIAAHTNPCSRVPTIAWYAPPPATNAVIPACECVHHALDVIARNPLAITEHSTQTNGAKAITIDSVTNTVATLFATRRRGPSPENVRALRGRSRIEVIGRLFGLRFRRQRPAPPHRPRR